MKRISALILFAILYAIPSFSQTMEWHIRDNYADIRYMGNNLFKVKSSNGKWGIINEYGETTVEVKYDSITPFVESRALLLDITGLLIKGIINEKGQIVKSFNNNEIIANNHFNEGMLAYGIEAGKHYLFGYLDINGNTRIKPQFFWAAPFNNGIAVVHRTSKNYGLIDKNGGTAFNDDRKFKFISTPVDNKLLIAASSNRGDKVSLVSLAPNGKLNEIEELETGTVVKGSNDYRSISCQTGHSYHFDESMRLISSSTGRTFNKAITHNYNIPASTKFNKMREVGAWKVTHSGTPLLRFPFKDITFCGEEYAIVTSQRNTMGVLKLNENGSLSVGSVPQQVQFCHNAPVNDNIAVNIDGLMPTSQVQIGIIGLKKNNEEEKFTVPAGYSGVHNQPISYFIPASSVGTEVSLPVKINLYIDGMLYTTEEFELTAVHKRGFNIKETDVQEFSDEDGKATIKFNVQSLETAPSASAKVTVSDTNISKMFNGAKSLSFEIPVTVPEEAEETFTFTVTVKEEGCPSYTKTIKQTIKHYFLK